MEILHKFETKKLARDRVDGELQILCGSDVNLLYPFKDWWKEAMS
jgi:hypothetical protein